MSKVSEVVKLRDEMIEHVGSLSRDDQRIWLAAKVQLEGRNKADPLQQMEIAFARVLWVRSKFHTDYRDGVTNLRLAHEFFAKLSGENRLLGFLKKDVAILWGNFCHDNEVFDEAIEHYQEALQHETNPDRKALALLNLARTYLRTKRFYQALDHAERVQVDTLQKDHLRQTFFLLKARILLVLGYTTLASKPLHDVLAVPELTSRVQIEARYLEIASKVSDQEFIAAKPHYEALITLLDQSGSESSANFYRLEWMQFAALLEAETIGSRKTFLQRTGYLARQVERADLHELARHLLQISSGDKYAKEDFIALQGVLAELRGRGEHLFYRQILVQIAFVLIKLQHYDKASEILREIEIYYQVGEALIPPKLAAMLGQHENTLIQTMTLLEGNCQPTYAPKNIPLVGFCFKPWSSCNAEL